MSNNKYIITPPHDINASCVINGTGKNIIPVKEKESLWKRYTEKLNDPLIIILSIALCMSVILSVYEFIIGIGTWNLLIEPLGIFIAIILSTVIGFYVEVKADKEFDVLNTVNDDEIVKVYRIVNGNKNIVPVKRKDIVVGDYIWLEAGDMVPVDALILHCNGLVVDESMFTGEPTCHKSADDAESNTAYPVNEVLRGSVVLEGNAECFVLRTGIDTEEGLGAKLADESAETDTPLSMQLNHLSKWLTYISMGFAVLVVVARIIYYFMYGGIASATFDTIGYIIESVMVAVTLVVAAVPEGLPMSIAMSLAMSMRKMLKENNLVRKLHACETMGATTVICTDKTGTLTKNEMTVVDFCIPVEYVESVLKNCSINSTATTEIGNHTERALLKWVNSMCMSDNNQNNIRYRHFRKGNTIISQQPFTSDTKIMITECKDIDGNINTYIKGAPEILMNMCTSYAARLTPEFITDKLKEYQSKAYRTIAFIENGVFMGIIGIADPLRDDVKESIDICRNIANVKVIMVTGDTIGTATEIGKQCGIINESNTNCIYTGESFRNMTESYARELLKNDGVKIIARATPADKAYLVELLKKNGEIVAVTGDGTNDAPALSSAHIGLSMGDGTSRAKEASDITIIDNSFSSINKAILWGRTIYKNIRRFIVFQMIVNICACIIVVFGAAVGMATPLNVSQLLWINLIMDTFAALALSTLPPDKHVMYEYPRKWTDHIVSERTAVHIFGYGILFSIFLCWYWMSLLHNNIGVMTLDPVELGGFFTCFVFIQWWNLFNARYFDTERSFVKDCIDMVNGKIKPNEIFTGMFIFISLLILIGQLAIVWCFPGAFGIGYVPVGMTAILFAITSVVFIIPEIKRNIRIL